MSEVKHLPRNFRILLLNPNSSTIMTEGMALAIRKMNLPEARTRDLLRSVNG